MLDAYSSWGRTDIALNIRWADERFRLRNVVVLFAFFVMGSM